MAKKPSQFETARTRGNRLYARLYSEILSGRLRPGEALSETRIAEEHGMSRTPVREVFQNLAKEGLLRIVADRHLHRTDQSRVRQCRPVYPRGA